MAGGGEGEAQGEGGERPRGRLERAPTCTAAPVPWRGGGAEVGVPGCEGASARWTHFQAGELDAPGDVRGFVGLDVSSTTRRISRRAKSTHQGEFGDVVECRVPVPYHFIDFPLNLRERERERERWSSVAWMRGSRGASRRAKTRTCNEE